MTLTLDPATEQLLQQELATGRYREPSELIAHALDLVKAERADLVTRRAEIVARLEESIAQADRGEGVTGEELRARFAIRRAERTVNEPIPKEMEDWLLRNKEAINRDLDETFAQSERGEGYSPQESRALLAHHRTLRAA